MSIRSTVLLSAVSGIAVLSAGLAEAATITGWNTENVAVAATPPDGETGVSVVYDQNPANPGATSSGQIVFTPPEAISPGIQVEQLSYTDGGPGGLPLDGCIMTSNPGATCNSPFQSGKRIKQQMTGFGPVDLVFDLEAGDEATYQVFSRLINKTSKSLAGFALEIGFGVGSDFVRATAQDGITISTAFSAQPTTPGVSVSTQFPFGLFGDASTNPNFDLDGFFAAERTGFNIVQTETSISSAGIFGPYGSIFGPWLTQDEVPLGAFWDNDNDDSTDALLMAWLNADGLWEVRRDVGDEALGIAVSLDTAETFATYAEVVARLGLDGSLFEGDIEDLANLNLNYAINVAGFVPTGSFTIRTMVAPVPVPYSAPLLAGGLGLLAMAARRRRRNAA